MKSMRILLCLLGLVSFVNAQIRTSLLEEFTGENCMPCAAYNPALDALLAQPANASKIIAIKWQVPIPSTPTSPSSLYQTNKPEIDWRYRGLGLGGYGYQFQSTQTSNVNDGIQSAPSCLIDGQNQWNFGVTGNHPYYLTSNAISTAASIATPFSINMVTSWNGSFTNCVVTVTVTSSSAFMAAGNLMFRLCLVERYIEFQLSPGTNGETIFRDAVRKSYPTMGSGGTITNMGTLLPSSWAAGQMQTLTINCTIPSYINDISQMAFVGFVQDDGDKKIYQATRSGQPPIPNDAKADEINIPVVVCTPTVLPTIKISNNGPNAITALTISPVVDGVPSTDITWTGNLAPSASTLLSTNLISTAAGSHTYAYTISGVSGGDVVTLNNHNETTFLNASAYIPAPVSEGFEGSAFPPSNWVLNNTGGENSFERSSNGGGYGLSSHSLGYQLYGALVGEEDELFLPPTNLVGTINSELSFDLAYQRTATSNDSLKVFLSSDCGSTWTKIYANGGSSMATAPFPINAGYYPLSSEWITVHIPLTGLAGSPEVLIKFQIKTDHGGGLYIDNVNLKGGTGNPPPVTTGIINREQNKTLFTLFPNPANSQATVVLDAVMDGEIELQMKNSLGQLVYSKEQKLATGVNSIEIDCKNFSEGIYLLRIKGEVSSGTKKLIIVK